MSERLATEHTVRRAGTLFARGRTVLCALVCSVGLAGCGGGFDEVRLEGGIFEAMGVAGNILDDSKKEQTVAARPGIVMPPDTKRLPSPGSGSVAALPPGTYWPQGPEDREAAERARLEAEQKAFCEREMPRAKVLNPSNPDVKGPLGSCNPGIGERWFGTAKARQ
ncbi:MAG: hypothetical protein AAFY64_04750 [Pseudomonadota bacterium]